MATGKVFISHSAADRPDVYALVDFLESHGIATWIAPRDIQPGLDYSESTQDAIEQCAAFVVVVTDAANESRFVRAETEMAFSGKRPIFPVRFREIAPARGLALFLKICHWTDAFGPQADFDRQRLASALAAASGPAEELGAPAPQSSIPATEAEPEPVALPLPQEADLPGLPAEPMVVQPLAARRRFPPVTRPRTAIAAGMAFLLVLAAWPLVGNRGNVIPDDAIGTPVRTDNVVVQPASPPRPVPKADGPPAPRSVSLPIATGRARPATSQAARRPAPTTTSSQRSMSPVQPPRRAPATPGTTPRLQMPCRSFTVTDGKSTDRNRACVATGGSVLLG